MGLLRRLFGLGKRAAADHNQRGLACFMRGDSGRALAEFTEAIQLDPTDATFYVHRGTAYFSVGDCDRAIADFTQALRLANPQNQDYEQTIADITGVIRLMPETPGGHLDRADCYRASGGGASSLQDERMTQDVGRRQQDEATAEALGQTDVETWISRAWAQIERGEYDQAIAFCTVALRLAPDNTVAYVSRGFSCVSVGEHDRAIADCTKAIRLARTYAPAYWTRGRAYNMKGEYDKAEADLAKARELGLELE